MSTTRNEQAGTEPPITTRAEASRLLRMAGVNMFSRNAVILWQNAVRGTYRGKDKSYDNAEGKSKQTVEYLFQGIMSRKRDEHGEFKGVGTRQMSPCWKKSKRYSPLCAQTERLPTS
jgi:hypothetical protein